MSEGKQQVELNGVHGGVAVDEPERALLNAVHEAYIEYGAKMYQQGLAAPRNPAPWDAQPAHQPAAAPVAENLVATKDGFRKNSELCNARFRDVFGGECDCDQDVNHNGGHARWVHHVETAAPVAGAPLAELAEKLCDCADRTLNGRARELANELREAIAALTPSPVAPTPEHKGDSLLAPAAPEPESPFTKFYVHDDWPHSDRYIVILGRNTRGYGRTSTLKRFDGLSGTEVDAKRYMEAQFIEVAIRQAIKTPQIKTRQLLPFTVAELEEVICQSEDGWIDVTTTYERLERLAPVATEETQRPASREQLRAFFLQHVPELWSESWRCRCGRWSLLRTSNDSKQADESRAKHLADELEAAQPPAGTPERATELLKEKELTVANHIRQAAPDGCQCEPCIACREVAAQPPAGTPGLPETSSPLLGEDDKKIVSSMETDIRERLRTLHSALCQNDLQVPTIEAAKLHFIERIESVLRNHPLRDASRPFTVYAEDARKAHQIEKNIENNQSTHAALGQLPEGK